MYRPTNKPTPPKFVGLRQSNLSFNSQFRVPLPVSSKSSSSLQRKDEKGLKISSTEAENLFITNARNLMNDDQSRLFIEIDDHEFETMSQNIAAQSNAHTDLSHTDTDLSDLHADMFTSPISVPKVVPASKRKSMESNKANCKKRLVDHLNDEQSRNDGWADENEIFESQFFEQIARLEATSTSTTTTKSPPTDSFAGPSRVDSIAGPLRANNFAGPWQADSIDGLSPANSIAGPLPTDSIASSPIIEKDDQKMIVQSHIKRSPKRPVATQSYNLTQFFNDDVDDEDFNMSNGSSAASSFPQSSQIFLEAVREIVPLPSTIDNANGQHITYTSERTASAYMQLQRDAHEVNENNLNDDDYIDPMLSQAYRSHEYRRELEEIFDNCENTICAGLENLIDEEEPPKSQHEVATTLCVAAVNDIDWSTSFVETPVKSAVKPAPRITPTAMVQQRLSLRKGCVSSTPPASHSFEYQETDTGPANGPFFGLPLKVKTLIRDYKGIRELYDWQKECLTLPAIEQRNNLIYGLPTNGGKTLVSEIIILRTIVCHRKNVIFILPYVSIVQEKVWALSPFAVHLDFLLEEYTGGKGQLPPRRRRKKRSVYIATIEKGLVLMNSLIEADRANEIGLIVVDELHIVGEPGRGAILENLLTKVRHINVGIQIVGMSATIGNLNEIATFLGADVYTRDFRPVELKEYIKCGSDILEIKPNAAKTSAEVEDAFKFVRTVDFNYHDDVKLRDPDHLAGLVSEVIPENGCLVFCASKKNCESVAILLSKMLPIKYMEHKRTLRGELAKCLTTNVGPLCPTLARTLPYGIAYHHAGLTSDERRHLEDAFRNNIISVICCTSTLAAGVNLPAKRVILRSPYVGRDFITLSRYKQMIGRAGRAGLCGDVGESILICPAKDYVRIGQLLLSPMDEALSGMHMDDCSGLRALVLSAIGLKLATCQTALLRFVGSTLMAVQANRLGIDTVKLTNGIIHSLFKKKVLSVDESALSNTSIGDASSQLVAITQTTETGSNGKRTKTVHLKPSTPLCVSQLGKASFKSGFDLAKAQIIYNDLVQAQQGLVVCSYLHLLYIVTPYEPTDINVQPEATIYYDQYTKLNDDERQVAKTLGITEACAIKIASGKQHKPALARTINRFFLTLVLHHLWKERSVYEVAETFKIDRGRIQTFITAATSYASGVQKFCEELPEFWAFTELFRHLTRRLQYCCTTELLPLMELPCVKIARAKQLHTAGFRNVEEIAKASFSSLMNVSEYITERIAKQLITAAKVLLLERVETKREEMQDCLDALNSNSK